MQRAIVSPLIACAILIGGGAVLAAPAQTQPGQLTQARVWIENRGSSQAIPVTIEDSGSAQRVQVINMPTVTIGGSIALPVRAQRQAWEYQTLNVPAGQDPMILLAPLGAQGWEVTGVQPAGQNAMLVLLKRPV